MTTEKTTDGQRAQTNNDRPCNIPGCIRSLSSNLETTSQGHARQSSFANTDQPSVNEDSFASQAYSNPSNDLRRENLIDKKAISKKTTAAQSAGSTDPRTLRMKITSSHDFHRVAIPKHVAFNRNASNETGFTRRLPQALIIGVKKGGTKALLTFLTSHPDIRSCKKEVHFFDKYYDKGLVWYRNRMPQSFPNQLTIEKSPRYFVTTAVPKRVYKMSPDIKLLVILRDPVKRAISDYVHMKTRKKKSEMKGNLDAMLFSNRSKHSRFINSSLPFIKTGMYSVHLKSWLKYFPREQIHFVNGDEMITNPSKQLASVQKFLHLNVLVDENNFVFNSSKRFYCVYKTLDDRLTRDSNAICLGKSKGRKHPRVAQATLRALQDFYRPYNKELYKLVGVDFGWQ